MSVVVIINPVSGGRPHSAGARVDLARRLADECGEAADVFVTQHHGHARELARAAKAKGARLVIAWGGDGTVNEVVSEIAFTDVLLGVVAAGSGNGLARALRVPADPGGALAAAIRATPRRIDVGTIDDRLFVNLAGVGFDAYVASCFNQPGSRRGFRGYVGIVARALATYVPQEYTIVIPDAELKVRAVLVAVANGTQYGNGVRIAPAARIDDGLLNLVIVQERRRVRTVAQLPRLFMGTIARSPDCTLRSIAEATISCQAPMTFHVDGEPFAGGTKATIRVHPAALKVAASENVPPR